VKSDSFIGYQVAASTKNLRVRVSGWKKSRVRVTGFGYKKGRVSGFGYRAATLVQMIKQKLFE